MKKCKGLGKAKGYGCGNKIDKHHYGLCDKCYAIFLLESPYGEEIIKSFSKRASKKINKEEKDKLKELKEQVKTESNYKKELQIILNFIVRHIDYDKGCISCNHGWNTEWTRQRQAGHYHSKKEYDNLRFNIFNIFCQCTICNDKLSANIDNYRKGVISNYGHDFMDYIDSLPLKYKDKTFTIPELKEAIEAAKKIKKDIISGIDYTRLKVESLLKLY